MSSRFNAASAAVVGAIAIAIAVYVSRQAPDAPAPPQSGSPASASAPEMAGKTEAVQRAALPATAVPSPTPKTSATVSPGPEPGINKLAGPMDPESQPRKWYAKQFNDAYHLRNHVMEGVEITPEGVRLKPPAPGEESTPRFGTIESPAESLEFASNAVTPYWLETLPERTDIVLELAMSPDGATWSEWMVANPDADSIGQINPTMPDGRPNPNYGHTPGGTFAFGNNQFGYFRYRVTLYSESPLSPTLESVRFFYQDSTLGEGRLVQVTESGLSDGGGSIR